MTKRKTPKNDETCQCGKFSYPPNMWEAATRSFYFSIADHMPPRLGGCTHLNGNVPPYKYLNFLHRQNGLE
jgi:hypothetical protein